MAQHYKDLIAWQKAMDLVAALYDATEAFPKREIYSLTNQMRRALSRFQATSRKVKLTTATVSFVTFFATRVDPWPSWKLRYSLQNEETT
jgi:hypothetical protein